MTLSPAIPAPTSTHRAQVWVLIVLLTLIAALAQFAVFNAAMESLGEDGAPVWNCYTMGNHRCGPDSPWHGTYFGPHAN